MFKNQFTLLTERRFLPLFVTQFLGALNDNVFKNALVILITYSLAIKYSYNAAIIIVLAGAIFIFPWLIFSGIAGQVADKYEKSKLIKIIKFCEIIIMMLACIGFYFESVKFLLLVLFLMGTQSSFFGPLKYSILPRHLQNQELVAANALVQMATFLAILFGTIIGTILVLRTNGVLVISVAVVLVAIFGWAFSIYIPKADPLNSEVIIGRNLFKSTFDILKYSFNFKDIFKLILGISWLWFLGATYISQFPVFVKDILGGDETVVSLLLAVFSIGIGVGALFCNKLLKSEIKTTFAPIAAIGMAVFGIDLFFTSKNVNVSYVDLLSFVEFFNYNYNIKVLIDLFFIALFGGIYVVPLYAALQNKADKHFTARVIASNNIMNAVFMIVSAISITVLLKSGFIVYEIFLIASLLTIIMPILFISKN